MLVKNAQTMLFAVIVLGLVAGCYESTDATDYEPGVYKGERDPWLDKAGTEEVNEELAARFENQTDR